MLSNSPRAKIVLLVKEREALGIAELLEKEERLIDECPRTVVAVFVREE